VYISRISPVPDRSLNEEEEEEEDIYSTEMPGCQKTLLGSTMLATQTQYLQGTTNYETTFYILPYYKHRLKGTHAQGCFRFLSTGFY